MPEGFIAPPFREAKLSDLAYLMALERESFTASRRYRKSSIRNSISSLHQAVWIIETADLSPAGSMTLRLYKDRIWISSIAVGKAYRGASYGKQLVQKAVAIAEIMNIPLVELEADAQNERLINWYRAMGFQDCGVIEDYYGPMEHGLLMRKSLGMSYRNLIVCDYETDFFDGIPGTTVIRANTYLENPIYQTSKDYRIYNLCASYRYQSVGYYVSLMALARNQVSHPGPGLIRDIGCRKVVRSIGEEMRKAIQISLSDSGESDVFINSAFGLVDRPEYRHLTDALNQLFMGPMIRYHFKKKGEWYLKAIHLLSLDKLDTFDPSELRLAAENYFMSNSRANTSLKNHKYDLAILVDWTEKLPPSDEQALQAFEAAATSLGFYVAYITKKDMTRLVEFDALFIRTTTDVNDYTYEFSRFAYAEGLVVVDDPWSILRCANKIYLKEALGNNGINTPMTWVLNRRNLDRELIGSLPYPIVLKRPDSAFSAGVVKVMNDRDCLQSLKKMFRTSDLILAQEYLPTAYDWRIGIMDGEVLYACKYFMAKDHWQIVQWENDHSYSEGDYATVPIDNVPVTVLNEALKAAAVIGDGLYGVDIKEIGDRAVVIEVNDNPSIDYGVEDGGDGYTLYSRIMTSLYNRLENAMTVIRNVD